MIVLVGGVAGSGKTTVGTLLAHRLNWTFVDADAFHTVTDIAKMKSGIPLTDADRRPWLDRIGAWMDEQIAAGESAVGGCSALKRYVRDELLTSRPESRMAFLSITRELAHARVEARTGHFFAAKLVGTQFAICEPPHDEPQVIVIDGAQPAVQLVHEIIERLGLAAQAAAQAAAPQPRQGT